MPPFVYFDLGNVLYRFCHERMARQMAALVGMSPEAVWEVVFREDLGNAFDRGELSREQFYERFCTLVESRPKFDSLEEALCDIFEPIPETFAIAEELAAAGVPRGILSNTNHSHWLFVNRRFGDLKPLFPVIALSYELGMMKPHPTIYAKSADLAGRPPGEILFFDDREENIAGAIAAGWNAVLFESAEQMRRELVGRGVLAG